MNPITWGILWAIAGWLIGILLYFGGPFFLALAFDDEKRNALANHYSKIGMKLMGRAVLVERGVQYDIFKTTHKSEKGGDEFTVGDKTAHVTNETGLLSTLHGKPFGLVPPPEENVSVYVSPELAEFGKIEGERKEQGRLLDEDGNYIDEVSIPPTRPMLKLGEYVRRMVPESRPLFDLDETEELYRQSQALFGDKMSNVQLMVLVIAFGASMLVAWLVMTQAGGAVPEQVIQIPTLGVMLP